MRIPKYLSPSALNRFEADRDDFYLMYLCENRPPRQPQTEPMSVGSAFDSLCKSELYWRAFGRHDEAQSFEYLFDRSVEPHNRDFALAAGRYVFDAYCKSGAFEALDALLQASDRPPQFEFEIQEQIDGVPLLGKPDCRFFHQSGAHIIFDWKVNGFCSRSAVSPCKYYSMVVDGWGPETAPPSRNANKSHPEYKPYDHKGIQIHEGYLEQTNTEWADQLSTYAWMLREPVGSEDVVMSLHQIVAKPRPGEKPLLRTAAFAARVSKLWQENLLKRYKLAWEVINSGHIFTDMIREQSDDRCVMLDRQAEVMGDETDMGKYVRELMSR